jgi:hypothetical protein
MKDSIVFMDLCLSGFFYGGLVVRVYFALFWKVGCRYWGLDGTGILRVLPVQLFRRH